GQARVRLVEHGDQEGERGDPVRPAGVRQVRGYHRGDDAAGAGPRERGPLAAGDPLGRVHGVQDGLAVRVEVPLGVPRVRVAPGDHEHLQALADQVLHHAAARGQVHHVELVDHRRDDQPRDLAYLGGDRTVLDQLEYRGPQHYGTRRYGEVRADFERVVLDYGRDPRCDRHVAEEMPQARHRAPA